MGRYEVQPEDLWEKAIAKGYKQGAHRTEDSKRDSTTYEPKTLKDQNGALKRYDFATAGCAILTRDLVLPP